MFFKSSVESCSTLCPELTKLIKYQKNDPVHPPSFPFLPTFRLIAVRDSQNLTNWREAFFHHPAPYFSDSGFPNPPCLSRDDVSRVNAYIVSSRSARSVSGGVPSLLRLNQSASGTYVIGENDSCLEGNNTEPFCNGPLKPSTVYV